MDRLVHSGNAIDECEQIVQVCVFSRHFRQDLVDVWEDGFGHCSLQFELTFI